MTSGVRLGVFRVKEMRAANAAQSAERNSQILMIARRHDPATTLAKTRDALTVRHTEPIAGIDREQPQLVKVRLLKVSENWIIAVGIHFAIPGRHFTDFVSACVFHRTQLIAQQREAADMPIVFGKRNGSLQQDPDWFGHKNPLVVLTHLCRQIIVPCIVAANSRSAVPAMAKTSARTTVSVFPALITSARATNVSPCAGRNRFTLNSTLKTSE